MINFQYYKSLKNSSLRIKTKCLLIQHQQNNFFFRCRKQICTIDLIRIQQHHGGFGPFWFLVHWTDQYTKFSALFLVLLLEKCCTFVEHL